MNKKLAIPLKLVVGSLAIISVSHLLIAFANNCDRTNTEVEEAKLTEQENIIMMSPPISSAIPIIKAEQLIDETKEPEVVFHETNDLVYTTSRVNLREEPSTNSNVHATIDCSKKLSRVGYYDNGWSKVQYDDSDYYISSEYIGVVTDDRLDDIELIARIIHAEAGNQSAEGQRAVGSVVYNRWHYDGFGGSDTIIGVISYSGQFCGYQSDQWYNDYSEETYQIAAEIYDGHTNLPSDVRYFKTNSCNANWDLRVYDTIGDHTFYYSN